LDEKNVRTIIIYAFQLQSLDELVQERKDELKFLVNQNNTLNSKIKELEVKLKQLNNIYIRNQSEVDRLNNVIKSKSTYLNTLENSINDLINGEDYPGILEIVQQKVTSILNSKENLLIASIVTVLYILRNHPNKAILIIDPEYYDYEMCITTNSEDFLKDSSFKKYIKTHYKPILDIANILYEKILKQVQNDILFSSPKI